MEKMNLKDREPELRDEVKHKNHDVIGIVIEKYKMDGYQYLDVRGSNEKIYYQTPAKNWEVVKLKDE
jgi:hypothetical protein